MLEPQQSFLRAVCHVGTVGVSNIADVASRNTSQSFSSGPAFFNIEEAQCRASPIRRLITRVTLA